MTHAITESTYGSDKAGLVCAYAFTPGRPGRAIDSDEAAAVVLIVVSIVSAGIALAWNQRDRR